MVPHLLVLILALKCFKRIHIFERSETSLSDRHAGIRGQWERVAARRLLLFVGGYSPERVPAFS